MRIVSLCPSITETLIDFGLASSLVGITRFCIHPAEVVASLPKVGGTKSPDLDAIRAAAPDLIFMNEEENRLEDYEALAKDLRVDRSLVKTVSEVPQFLRHAGALTGATSIAEKRAAAVEAALAERPLESKARFVYLIWREPYMAVGADTYVSDLLAWAGGHNVFASRAERYPELDLEVLADLAPSHVLLSDEPYPFGPKHHPEIQRALPGAKILDVSGDDCCWHGVRTLRGLALARGLFAGA